MVIDITKKIIDIICPYCKKNHLILKHVWSSGRWIWICSGDCVYAFPGNWFNVFTHFEMFVTRGE